MPIEIVEEFVQSRTVPEACEDRLVHTPDFAAIIDGATAKAAVAPGARSPGGAVADCLAAAIPRLRADISRDGAIDLLTETVRMQNGDMQAPGAAVFALLSRHRREVWRVGDCQVRIGDRDHPAFHPFDTHTAALRAAVNRAELRAGRSVADIAVDDTGRAAILPVLARQHLFVNDPADRDFGYGAMTGTDIPNRLRETLLLPPHPVEVILCSDGYPTLRPSLAEAEADLAARLAEDPLCIDRHPATKGLRPGANSFDDRAYLRLRT